MIDISPKRQFQKLREADCTIFANVAPTEAFRTAMTYAFAELAYGGVTNEELVGAKKFIKVFSAIHEQDEPGKLPAKTLLDETRPAQPAK